jgi:hypothetical protein
MRQLRSIKILQINNLNYCNYLVKIVLQFTFVLAQIIISQNWILYIFSVMFVTVNQIRCTCALNCNLSIVIWGRMFNSLKLKYTVRYSKKNKKTKEHMKCRYMYVYTRIIFVAVLSHMHIVFDWLLRTWLKRYIIFNFAIWLFVLVQTWIVKTIN